jgi:cell division septal protein FtsQ
MARRSPSSRLVPQRPVRKNSLLKRRSSGNSYRRAPKVEGKKLWLRGFFLTLGLAGLGGVSLGLLLIYHHLLTSPIFCIKDIKDIEIDGAVRFTTAQVLQMSGVEPGTSLLAVKPNRVEQALLSHPWIARAEVTRRWPNRLFLKIEERQPVALVQLGELYYVDRQGSLFKPTSPADPLDFPVITGLTQEHFTLTAGAPTKLVAQVFQLLDLLKEAQPPLTVANVSEIHVDPERGFCLFVNGLTTGIELGLEDHAEKLQKFAQVWPVLTQKGFIPKLTRINLDYPQRVLLTLKGGEEQE